MAKYLYSELLINRDVHNIPIPEEVNDFVVKFITPILNKFPEIKEGALELISVQGTAGRFTGQHRAVIPHPKIPTLPLVSMEFHNGVIKQFTYAKFFGICYFPENHRNESVVFDNINLTSRNLGKKQKQK